MRIGVTSDTHGSARSWDDVVECWGPVDLAVHAGDVLYHGPRNPLPGGHDAVALAARINSFPPPLVLAAGNCDAPIDQEVVTRQFSSPFAALDLCGCRVVVLHGTGMDRHSLARFASACKARLLISGHTHVPHLFEEAGCMFLNPGSPALPKTADGQGTCALISPSGIEIVRVSDRAVVAEWRGTLFRRDQEITGYPGQVKE